MNESKTPKRKLGPKPRTAANSRPVAGRIPGGAEPTGKLTDAELQEFDRLCGVLRQRGVLARVDLAAVTTLARLGVAIEGEFALRPINPRSLALLLGHARGIRRELGLSLQSSRVMTRTSAEPGDARSRWAAKLSGGTD